MEARSLTLVCKGGASVTARTATLVGASPVLCEALDKPLARAGELGLEEDDAETWGTALRLLEPEAQAEAALLSWDNIEPVLKLADKYDMAAVRGLCAGFLGANQADVSLDHELTSPRNSLYAATLLERYCSQPPLVPIVAPTQAAIAVCFRASTPAEANKIVRKLRELTGNSAYQDAIGVAAQARVTKALVQDLVPVVCHSCNRVVGLWGTADTSGTMPGAAAVGAGAAVAAVVYTVGKEIGERIAAHVNEDKQRRERFARELTAELCERFPDYDVIATCVSHSMEGSYVHQHAECYYLSGCSQGYEVYLIRHGDWAKFTRHGDGGWINWAMCGSRFNRSDNVVEWR
ncbi:hypothetical protein HYH03_015972 [Edaphochlamys debaryana]|uniref:Uncharacterized protein n=1 Tax=Edaphochlamys debaryana TaxID=47281 RepID=A0A835XJL3_9CHLO|nr:hypothetical protein HYH03_015972 [Edaphochlamys debaryana]|eukprot:KAG2485298.1 hypothetical protein HYH03_015972 [Edaphochlamys debaryana]